MIILVRMDHETMEAEVYASRSRGGLIWRGKATPYLLQWQADRREAFFHASDLPCLHPSGLPVILGETKEKF